VINIFKEVDEKELMNEAEMKLAGLAGFDNSSITAIANLSKLQPFPLRRNH